MKHNCLFLILFILTLSYSQAQTTINGSFVHGGITRTYSFYVPASYIPGQAVPLVIGLHGLSSSGTEFAQYRDFRPIADTANFIIVNPDGSTLFGLKFWNYGSIMGSTVDDVGFIEELIDTISAHYSINQNRVYSVGMSNGSFMTYYLACESNRFAAIGAVTGSMSTTMYANCNPSHPTPSIHIHGTEDNTNPYIGTSTMTPIADLTQFWVNQNSCDTTPTITPIANISTSDNATAERYLYSGGIDGNTVEHFKVIDGGHSWPGSPMPSSSEVTCMDFDASAEIWRFFSQYELSNAASTAKYSTVEFNLWPNPTQGIVYIQSSNHQVNDVTIFDLHGRLIEKVSEDNIQQLNLSHLKTGNYIAKISGKDFYEVKKLVISTP